MKKKLLLLSLIIFLFNITIAQKVSIPYFNSNGNKTPEYSEVINFYKSVSINNPSIKINLEEYDSDVLESIYLVSITKGNIDGKVNVLINNGIHPGEPEGIDASIILTKNMVDVVSKNKLEPQKYFNNKYDEQKILSNILDYANIYIIPIYNVDGSLRRNSTSRANQNGPEEYGFRGNAKNLDLNRDFIKMDSKNAKSFVKIFHKTKPHVFIDMHTSNGANYQHIVTYIATQKDKLQKDVSSYQYDKFIPELDNHLKKYKFDPVPYVNAWVDVPDSGWAAFYESPRYATGYSTLFNTIGFTVETHMLKNYKQRVEGSYAFLISSLDIIKRDAPIIIETKSKADENLLIQNDFPLNWKLDSTKSKYIEFKGFQAAYKKSEISGANRLYYDRTKPFTKMVKYYENYTPTTIIKKPYAYIIPRAWDEVIQRLKMNNVAMQVVSNDTLLNLGVYYIDDYRTTSKPYEGHYLHSNVKVRTESQKIKVSKGDYIVYTNQSSCRFIIETLEPQSIDSYFNWNFFDAILGQKEHFSDYVFEDTAAEMLKNNPELKKKLEKRKLEDLAFANSSYQQLEFIYKNSPYFEKSFLRYPVYRLEK